MYIPQNLNNKNHNERNQIIREALTKNKLGLKRCCCDYECYMFIKKFPNGKRLFIRDSNTYRDTLKTNVADVFIDMSTHSKLPENTTRTTKVLMIHGNKNNGPCWGKKGQVASAITKMGSHLINSSNDKFKGVISSQHITEKEFTDIFLRGSDEVDDFYVYSCGLATFLIKEYSSYIGPTPLEMINYFFKRLDEVYG